MPDSADQRFKEISALEDGWLDGEGVKVDRDIIESCKELLELLSFRGIEQSAIYPTPEGGISLEWDVADGGSIQFSFQKEGVRVIGSDTLDTSLVNTVISAAKKLGIWTEII